MLIVEITPLSNGGHRNQSGEFETIPEGWAVVPYDMQTPAFPFGEVTAEKINGIMTVTSWKAGTIPEQQPAPEPEPTTDDILNVLLEGLGADKLKAAKQLRQALERTAGLEVVADE